MSRRDHLTRRLYAILRELPTLDRDERIQVFRYILWRPTVQSTNDLDENDLTVVVDVLDYWKRSGRFKEQAAEASKFSQ